MDTIVISGVKPYDGRYEFELGDELTTREWGWIKRLSGYLPSTLDSNSSDDPELVCVFAVIALHRVGRITRDEVPSVFDKLIDAPYGSTLTLEVGESDGDDDASPPALSSNGSESTFGPDSVTSSDQSTETPPDYGTRDSDTSLSVHETSAT
jgi:hypothetical protein